MNDLKTEWSSKEPLIVRPNIDLWTYPSYDNGEKDRYVCRPSREDGVHNGYDRRKQAVKMADIYGVEKV